MIKGTATRGGAKEKPAAVPPAAAPASDAESTVKASSGPWLFGQGTLEFSDGGTVRLPPQLLPPPSDSVVEEEEEQQQGGNSGGIVALFRIASEGYNGISAATGRDKLTDGSVASLRYQITFGSAFIVVGIADAAKASEARQATQGSDKEDEWYGFANVGYNPYFGRLRPADPQARDLSDEELPKREYRQSPTTIVDVDVDMIKRRATFSIDGSDPVSIGIPSAIKAVCAYAVLGMHGDTISLAVTKKK